MTEIETLKRTIVQVRRWLEVLSRESLDANTLGVIHACVHAMDDSNPRISRAIGAGSNYEEVNRLARILADHVAEEGADLYYAIVLHRAAEMIEDRRQEKQGFGFYGRLLRAPLEKPD